MLVRGFAIRSFLDKDSGAGAGAGGGNDGGDGGDGGGKTYTEAEVQKRIEQSMIRHRKQLQKENKEKETQIQTLSEQLKALQEEMKAKLETPPATGTDDSNPFAGQMKLLEQRTQREIDTLKQKLAAESEARAKAEQIAKEQRRDAIITKALQDAGCNDIKVGFRYLAPDVYWEEDEERWFVKTDNGGVEINGDNFRDILPDHLKTPLGAGRSGSGSTTAAGRLSQKLNELTEEKKKLVALQSIRGATDDEVIEMLRQKRKVAALELEVANARK